MKKAPHYYQGFTLVEMSIVLLIMGLLLSSSLPLLSGQVEVQRMKSTQKILDETREALVGFAIVNGRLPRPAQSWSVGLERATDCQSDAECTGFIPWVTLGTTKVDAWEKIVRYSVTPDFSDSVVTNAATGISNRFTNTTVATKLVQTRDAKGAPVPATLAVPAVIFSHGKKFYGTSRDGLAFPSPSLSAGGGTANFDETTNDTGTADTPKPQSSNPAPGVTFVVRTFTASTSAPGGEFDDLVIWLSQSALSARMAQAGWTMK
jgi:prepilin-type N-terminal cleavage/methylation domain-containing protein